MFDPPDKVKNNYKPSDASDIKIGNTIFFNDEFYQVTEAYMVYDTVVFHAKPYLETWGIFGNEECFSVNEYERIYVKIEH